MEIKDNDYELGIKEDNDNDDKNSTNVEFLDGCHVYSCPFTYYYILFVCNNAKKLDLCICHQNKASNPNQFHAILKAEIDTLI